MRRWLVAVVTALVLAVPAAAGPPGAWTRLPGSVSSGAEPGLARTSDGMLHVVYVRKNGTKSDLVHLAVSPAGKVGGDAVAVGGWAAMAHPDLLRARDNTLRAFFGGILPFASGLHTATAPASGRPWTLQPGRAAQAEYAYATTVTGAGLAKDGTPISTWSAAAGLGFHYGTDPTDADGKVPQSGCCLYAPEIAVDAMSGQAYVGFLSLEKNAEGVYAQAISPSGVQGKRWLAPGIRVGTNVVNPGGRTALTARIGAPGVFLAHGQGYPTYKTVAVSRVGASKPQLVIKADRAEHVNVAAAPDGRLWLMWEQNGTISAARTNRSATRVGAVNAIRPPSGATIYRLNGDGSAGPLDLVANMQAAGGQALWHQQVWPKLSLTGSRSGTKIVFRVTDAGDAVPGATVRAGGKTLKTNASGRATLAQAPAGRVPATASKPDYAPATASVR